VKFTAQVLPLSELFALVELMDPQNSEAISRAFGRATDRWSLSSHFGDVVAEAWGWLEVEDTVELEDDMGLDGNIELEGGMVLIPSSSPSLRLGSPK